MTPYLTPMIDHIRVKPYVLEKGYKNIAVVFLHGLGDTLMFRDVLAGLCEELPDVKITTFVLETQEPLIEGARTWRGDDCLTGFEQSFVLQFPMSEGSGVKKNSYCARVELGLDRQEFDILPYEMSMGGSPLNRLVGVHFQGTALPGSVNPSPEIAKMLWETLVRFDYMPVEVHFQHLFHNPVNTKPDWVTTTLRGQKPSIPNIYSVIANAALFVGVASGPMVMSLAIAPERTIFLQKDFELKHYTSMPVKTVNLNNFNIADFARFLTPL